jgi:hypothetical protein
MISRAEVERARRDVAEALFDTPMTVLRRAEAREPGGGFVSTYSSVWEGLGRYAPSSAAQTEIAARLNYTTSVTITLPAGVDVQADDRVVAAGRTFEVFAVLGRRTWEIVTRVLAAEVT